MPGDGSRAEAAIQELYAALERGESERIEALVADDVFVLPGTADAGAEGRTGLVAALGRFVPEDGVRIRVIERRTGTGPLGRSAWIFDQLDVGATPVRLTGLMVDDGAWRLAAAYWSIPIGSNAEQHERVRDGLLEAGFAHDELLSAPVRPLADALTRSLQGEGWLPDLYSTSQDAVTIGSTVDEIFRGPAARAAWEEFITLEPRLAVRGGIRGALAPGGDVAWLATHVDISFSLTTPYRFFYVWVREDEAWRIVVSHDGVSMPIPR